jgi:uncharacterized membrane protein YGL010W
MTKNLFAVSTLCRIIRWASLIFLASVFTIQLFVLFLPPSFFTSYPQLMRLNLAGVSTQLLTQLSFDQRMVIALVNLPQLAALLWAYSHLVKLLRSFERGDFFTREAVAHLRAFAGITLLAKLLSWLTLHARIGTIVQFLGDGKFSGKLSLTGDDLTVLLMCALFFLIARAMEVGREAAEENKAFI